MVSNSDQKFAIKPRPPGSSQTCCQIAHVCRVIETGCCFSCSKPSINIPAIDQQSWTSCDLNEHGDPVGSGSADRHAACGLKDAQKERLPPLRIPSYPHMSETGKLSELTIQILSPTTPSEVCKSFIGFELSIGTYPGSTPFQLPCASCSWLVKIDAALEVVWRRPYHLASRHLL